MSFAIASPLPSVEKRVLENMSTEKETRKIGSAMSEQAEIGTRTQDQTPVQRQE